MPNPFHPCSITLRICEANKKSVQIRKIRVPSPLNRQKSVSNPYNPCSNPSKSANPFKSEKSAQSVFYPLQFGKNPCNPCPIHKIRVPTPRNRQTRSNPKNPHNPSPIPSKSAKIPTPPVNPIQIPNIIAIPTTQVRVFETSILRPCAYT